METISELFPKLNLSQICKRYHQFAELAVNEINVEICLDSLQMIDENAFCGFPPETEHYLDDQKLVCSYNATSMLECNTSNQTQIINPCIWRQRSECYWDGKACIKNSVRFDSFDVACDKYFNQSTCEPHNSDFGECVPISSMSPTNISTYTGAHFCSTISVSVECNNAAVYRVTPCEWHNDQLDMNLLQSCCRVSSSWCDEVFKYFNFLSEDKIYRGDITYRDVCGPGIVNKRSQYPETELQKIDEECCNGTKLKYGYNFMDHILNPTSSPSSKFDQVDGSYNSETITITNDTQKNVSSFPSAKDSELEALTQSPSNNFYNLHDDDFTAGDSTNTIHLEVYSDGSSSYVAKANIGIFSLIPALVILASWLRKRKRDMDSGGSEDINNLSQYEHVTSDSFDFGENIEDQSQFEHLPDKHPYHHVLDDSYDATRHDMKPYEANTMADDDLDHNILFPSLSEFYPAEPV